MSISPDSTKSLESAYADSYFAERRYRKSGLDRMVQLNNDLIAIREYNNKYRNDSIVYNDKQGVLFSLDLHGFSRESATVAVDRFLSECIDLKSGSANIIYGQGNVLSSLVPQMLDEKGIRYFKFNGYLCATGIIGGSYNFGKLTDSDLMEEKKAIEEVVRERERKVRIETRDRAAMIQRNKEIFDRLVDDHDKKWPQNRLRKPEVQNQGCSVILFAVLIIVSMLR